MINKKANIESPEEESDTKDDPESEVNVGIESNYGVAISSLAITSQSAPSLLGTSLPVAIPARMASWKSQSALQKIEDEIENDNLSSSFDLPLSSTRRINHFL